MRIVAAGCFTLVVVIACSDSPLGPPELKVDAAHFDSLLTLAIQSHDTTETRQINLQMIANALAHGAQPTQLINTQGLPCHLAQGTVSFSALLEAFDPLPGGAEILSPTFTFGIAQFDGL